MKYPKPIMTKGELKKMGFKESWLDYIFKMRPDLKIANRVGNAPNSPIQYDTELLEKFREACCVGEKR